MNYYLVPADDFNELSFDARNAWRKIRTEVNDLSSRNNKPGVAFLVDIDHRNIEKLKEQQMNTLNKNQKIEKLEKDLLQAGREINRLLGMLNARNKKPKSKKSSTAKEPAKKEEKAPDGPNKQASLEITPVSKVTDMIDAMTDDQLAEELGNGFFVGETRVTVLSHLHKRGVPVDIPE